MITLLAKFGSEFDTSCVIDVVVCVCRCLRCVQAEPRGSWSRVPMTRAALPSGNLGEKAPCHRKSEQRVKNMSVNVCMVLRMDDKGEVKCIKFSIGNKILAVQRTIKSVVSWPTNQSTAPSPPGRAASSLRCFCFWSL